MAPTARELGRRKDTLSDWVRQSQEEVQPVQDPVKTEQLYDELKRLRQAVAMPQEARPS